MPDLETGNNGIMSLLTPPHQFERYREYLAPLLSLMGQIGSAPSSDVKQQFLNNYNQFIPIKDNKVMDSGKLYWSYNLEWARSDLNQLGLMESPGRGIWAISEDGHIWLKTHSDYAHATQTIDTFLSERSRALRGVFRTQTSYRFEWNGREFLANANDLLRNATDLIAEGNHPDAFTDKDWYVALNDQKVSPKWLFQILTGAAYDEFVTYQAVIILRSMGLPIFKVGESEVQPSAEQSSKPVTRYQAKAYDLDATTVTLFYTEVEKLLAQKLSDFAANARIHSHPELKYIQISFPEFSFMRFVMELRQEDEFSWRFESQDKEANYQRLEKALPSVERWRESLKTAILAEKWGERRARIGIILSIADKNGIVYMKSDAISSAEILRLRGKNIFEELLKQFAEQMPAAPFWEIKAKAYATLIAQFIQVSLPDLQTLFANQVRTRRTPAIQDKTQANSNARQYELIDQKINEIRDFLSGRSVRIPKDEELCDWIQLCYMIELHREGQTLFTFVQTQTLNNDWLYRRTKRYADLCRLKAPNKDG